MGRFNRGFGRNKMKSRRLEDIVGVEIVNEDIRLGHTFYEVEVIEKIISIYKPKVFVEIGIHEGGLSYLLIPKFKGMYYGVELYCNLIRPEVKDLYTDPKNGAILKCDDCFSPSIYNDLMSFHDMLIYCDGGNKAKEIQHFKSVLHPGDVIMTHDYWDGVREIRDVPYGYYTPEVVPPDIQIYEDDVEYTKIDEELLKETRIIGWRKNA